MTAGVRGARRLPRARWSLVALVLLVSTGCSGGSAGDAVPQALVIATGEPSGVYYRYGQGLAAALAEALPGADVRAVSSSGSVDNLQRLASGRAQVAFSLADSAVEALPDGTGGGDAVGLRALARLYTNSLHVVVPESSPAERVADLGGLRVSVGAAGSGTELTATRVLQVAGVRPGAVERLGVQESAAALSAGRLDAFFWSGGLPTEGVEELVDRTPVRLLATNDLLTGMRGRFGEYVVEQTIPPSVYGTAGEVSTIGVPNLLLVRADMPDALAEALTAALFAHQRALVAAHPEARYLDPRAAITTTPVPLHPGAARYYRSAKPGVGSG